MGVCGEGGEENKVPNILHTIIIESFSKCF